MKLNEILEEGNDGWDKAEKEEIEYAKTHFVRTNPKNLNPRDPRERKTLEKFWAAEEEKWNKEHPELAKKTKKIKMNA